MELLTVVLVLLSVCSSVNSFAVDKIPITELDVVPMRPVIDCKIAAKNGDFLSVYYTGTLYEDGTVFDSNVGGRLYTFTLGHGQVIQGYELGVPGMCKGEKRRLIVPPHLAYGERGYDPVIPHFTIVVANAALIFEVELVDIERPHQEL